MTSHWDEFSKSLAEESLPRRESLRRLGFLLAGAVLSPLGVGTAWARGPDPCKTFCRCRKGTQQNACLAACRACGGDTRRVAGSCGNYTCCGAGQTNCGSYCADLGNDWYNCGACDHLCSVANIYESSACIDGQCEYWCVEGAVRCDRICTRLEYDPYNCGACGNVCGGETPFCDAGSCIGCPPGLGLCDNSCIDLRWDDYNCGACGNVCGGSTPYCNHGECSPCWPGTALCDGQCVDVTSNPNHCGACGNVCGGSSPYCDYGVCVCPRGMSVCDGECIDILNNPDNCGACGAVCPSSAPYCHAGGCSDQPCAPGLTWCSESYCAYLFGDPYNCGGCGYVCPLGMECWGGVCYVPYSDPGYGY